MSLTAREFEIDLNHFGATTTKQATTILRKIALELDQGIVLSTPVDTGRARGNWFPSLHLPSVGINEDLKDQSGGGALSAVQKVVFAAKLGDMIWMSNNLPYIQALEDGHSKQAPQGMVAINVARVVAFYGGRVS